MNYFVIFVIFASILVVHVQCQSSKDIMKYVRECKQETGTIEDIVKILKKSNMPKTTEGNCCIACICKRTGAMEANNEINSEVTKKLLTKMQIKSDKAETIANTCKSQVGTQSDPCEAGKLFAQCVMENK